MSIFEVRGGRLTPAKLYKKYTKFEMSQELFRTYDRVFDLREELTRHCDCEFSDPRDDGPISECQYHQEMREEIAALKHEIKQHGV